MSNPTSSYWPCSQCGAWVHARPACPRCGTRRVPSTVYQEPTFDAPGPPAHPAAHPASPPAAPPAHPHRPSKRLGLTGALLALVLGAAGGWIAATELRSLPHAVDPLLWSLLGGEP